MLFFYDWMQLGYTCAVVDTIRKGSKERKPISHLVAVEVRFVTLYLLSSLSTYIILINTCTTVVACSDMYYRRYFDSI